MPRPLNPVVLIPGPPAPVTSHRGRGGRLLSYRTPTTCPRPPGTVLRAGTRPAPDRGRLVPELRVEPDGGDDLAGRGRGMARLEAGGQVFGEGGVIEHAPGEPVPAAADRTLVGATGVGADRSGGELAGLLPAGRDVSVAIRG